MTLSCHSHLQFVIFTIFKRSGTRDHVLHTGLSNNITIGPVTPGHAGTYRCSGSYNHTTIWSAHSKSLKIVVTGRRSPARPMSTRWPFPESTPSEARVIVGLLVMH